MKKFKKIVALDNTGMNEEGKALLQTLGEAVEFFEGVPDEQEAIRRIGDADCVLVSLFSTIPRSVIEACPNIRYIGLSCSLFRSSPASCKVDLAACDERGIEVTGIFHYGDAGVREFVVAALAMLLHGHQKYLWGDYPHELTYRKFGVIGLGTVGKLVCEAMKFFGADIYYTDQQEVPDAEERGFKYLPLDDLLRTVDIVSIHVPRGSCVMTAREFDIFGPNKILVNCSLGTVFDVPAMKQWLTSCENNFYLADKDGAGDYFEEFKNMKNTIIGNNTAGASVELTNRRSEKMLENMRKFLGTADK